MVAQRRRSVKNCFMDKSVGLNRKAAYYLDTETKKYGRYIILDRENEYRDLKISERNFDLSRIGDSSRILQNVSDILFWN